jgi:hypothetical protein
LPELHPVTGMNDPGYFNEVLEYRCRIYRKVGTTFVCQPAIEFSKDVQKKDFSC